MSLFAKWEELLITQDIEKFVKLRNALDKEGIEYKEKIQNLGHNTRRSGQIGTLGETASCSSLYQIFVKKADLDEAKEIHV